MLCCEEYYPKMIDEGTIDTDLLESIKRRKKMDTANVATLQDSSVSYASSNLTPTYSKAILMSDYKFVPMISLGLVPYHGHGAKAQDQHNGEAYIPCNHDAWANQSAPQGSQDRRRRRSEQHTSPRVTEAISSPRFAPRIYRHLAKRMKGPSEEFNVLTIGVFEGDDESLYFFEEEPLEADQVQLRSGRQLADPHPPPRKDPKSSDAILNESTDPACRIPVRYDVISHLKKIPAILSVYDALCLSSDMRKALVTALTFPEDYRVEVSQTEMEDTEV
jgi:hypothetical protein